jgi:predicted acyltransferase
MCRLRAAPATALPAPRVPATVLRVTLQDNRLNVTLVADRLPGYSGVRAPGRASGAAPATQGRNGTVHTASPAPYAFPHMTAPGVVTRPPPAADVRPHPDTSPPSRLVSLDVFRGLTIAGMLLVNNPGTWSHIHPPLRHAEWHGWTPTDLIFPFFLFIVGVALTFSFGRLRERGETRRSLMGKAGRRAAILFGLGLLLHGFPNYLDLATLRIPGVLQRIALAYFAASLIVLYLRPRGQAVMLAVLLFGYWALQTLVPVPGVGAGILEPGRDLGAWLDRIVFTEAHLWSQARTWDPEGLLSTLPAVGTVLCGVFAGAWLRSAERPSRKAAFLALAGAAALGLGLVWDAWFPINKNLWTSSYVVFTAGFAGIVLAGCYWLVDVRRWRLWAVPFVIYGTNAIAAFFLSGLFARVLTLVRVPDGEGTVTLKGYIFDHVFLPLASPVNASLAYAVTFVLLWLGLMWLLYRRGIFIRV